MPDAPRTAVIGLGDMGLPIALNLRQAGLAVAGCDLRPDRCALVAEAGGTVATTMAEVAAAADTVLIMVMHGQQVHELVLGADGLLKHLQPGAGIVITATIRPEELDKLIEPCAAAGVDLVDCPVSGGRAGAEGGNLTLMPSGTPAARARLQPVFDAIGGKVFAVGDTPGLGMRAKTALQASIGTTFCAVFEGLALAAKAGVDGQAMLDILTNSAIASPMVNYCAERIMKREFTGTGSQMATIHKDVGISLDFARATGTPLYTTAAAFQVFAAAMSKYPGEDNWAAIKVIEDITGAPATTKDCT